MNIDTYYDDALRDVVSLVDSVLDQYRTAHPDTAGLSGRELEDQAFKEAGLESVQSVLELIAQKKQEIAAIDSFLDEKTEVLEGVLVPPDEDGALMQGSGVGFTEHATRNQVKAVILFLQENGIDLDGISVQEGKLRSDMMRKTSYTAIGIDSIHRIALVCDEQANVSYVFDTQKLADMYVEDVLRMTKKELNAMAGEHPDAIARVHGTQKWGENMQEALFGDLSEKARREASEKARTSQDLPLVSRDELDPWKGFYTNPEDGKHYAPLHVLGQRLDTHKATLSKRLEGLPSLKVMYRFFSPVDAYALEDVEAIFNDFLSLPIVAAEGEWKGFLEKDGKHYGSILAIAKRCRVDTDSIEKFVSESNLAGIKVKRELGKPGIAYEYEAIAPHFEGRGKIPRVETEGEWKGFYRSPEGEYYGPIKRLYQKLGINEGSLASYIERTPSVRSVEIRSLSRTIVPAYAVEDIEKWLKELQALPVIEKDGEWAGFVEVNGHHMGSTVSLGKRFGRAPTTVQERIKRSEMPIKSMMVMGGGNLPRPVMAYSYEDVFKLYKNKP